MTVGSAKNISTRSLSGVEAGHTFSIQYFQLQRPRLFASKSIMLNQNLILKIIIWKLILVWVMSTVI